MENKIETVSVKPEMVFVEKENEHRLLNFDTESRMDSYIEDFSNYIKSETGKNATEEEKDVLYAKAQDFIRNLKVDLRDSKFKFHMNRPQYTFLTNLILQKMEYDVNTVFIAIELTDLMVGMKELSFPNDKEYLSVDMTPTEVTYLYHIISTHKIKGLTKDAYLFANILRRIGEISKIINYYDNQSKDLTKDISIWAANLGGSELVEEVESSEIIK
jgi:hypothetical protein